jgi:two-component system capsular synthesis sensor histidine kinase RcsC
VRPSLDFQAGKLLLDGGSDVISQLLLGAITPQVPLSRFSRLVEFSKALTYSLAASVREDDESFPCYFFNPAHNFLSIASSPKQEFLLAQISPHDIPRLIDLLSSDLDDFSNSLYLKSLQESRYVFWGAPAPDPLTGGTALRVTALAFDGKQLFGVFVSSVAFEVLHKWLRQSRYGGNFMVIDHSGELILSSWDRKVIDEKLTNEVLKSAIWKEQLNSSDYVYRDGMFSFSEPLGNTGWVFAYVHSWKTIWAARGKILMLYFFGASLLLSLLWGIIYLYLEKKLKPLLKRSQGIFESEQLNRSIVATAPSGLCLISENTGQVVLQNSLMHVYDNDDDSLSKRLLHLRFCQRKDSIAAGKKLEPHTVCELIVLNSANEKKFLLVHLVEFFYLDEEHVLCCCMDITERKNLENNLIEERGAAEKESYIQSNFLAMMSHEIRTPLNGILGNLELLSYSPLSRLQHDRLATVTNASRGLLEIINDALDLSKIESGKMQLEKISYDLVDLVEQVISIFLVVADKKSLDLYYRVASNFPRWQIGDPTRMRQIVMNLLSNAIKFTAQGQVRITLGIERHPSEEKYQMVLRVADTGIGISQERHQKLFSPFEQGDVSFARQYGGTGLGLSLCCKLSERMGGSISLKSREGEGAEFTVSLPLVFSDIGFPLVEPILPGVVGVLCDDMNWRLHLIDHLQDWGLTVRFLKSPEDWRCTDRPVILFGDQRTWSVTGEQWLLSRNVRIVDGRESGPRQPLMQAGRVLISCYSLDALRRSLLMVQNLASSSEVIPINFDIVESQDCPDSSQSIRVLAVEDHTVSRELIGDQLRLLGYFVSLASDAGDALQLYCSGNYDVVLTDLSMPKTNGCMLAKMLREQGSAVPIIAITAGCSPDEHRLCREAGISDVLIKPMSLREIDCVVRRYLKCASNALSKMEIDKNKTPSLKQIRALRMSSDVLLQEICDAFIAQCRTHVLERLHTLKGAFAMQRQFQVVDACRDLEDICEKKMPMDFLDRMKELQILLHGIIDEMERCLDTFD